MKNVSAYAGTFLLTVAAVLTANFIWQQMNKPKITAPATGK